MAVDALDPGPDGDFPHWPRNADGTSRMPTGIKRMRDPEDWTGVNPLTIDVTPRDEHGDAIGPADVIGHD